MARHPQIGQRKQGGDLRRILLEPPVAGLHVAKLALDHPKRMFHLGANTGLELLGLVQQLPHLAGLLEGFALAWAHGHMPSHGGISTWALLDSGPAAQENRIMGWLRKNKDNLNSNHRLLISIQS